MIAKKIDLPKVASNEANKVKTSISNVSKKVRNYKFEFKLPEIKNESKKENELFFKVPSIDYDALAEELKNGQKIISLAENDISRGNKVVADRVSNFYSNLKQKLSQIPKNVQSTKTSIEKTVKDFEAPKVNISVEEIFTEENIKTMANKVAEESVNFYEAGLQRENIKELKEAFEDYPKRVSSQLDKNGYWTKGRGKEILDEISKYEIRSPIIKVK